MTLSSYGKHLNPSGSDPPRVGLSLSASLFNVTVTPTPLGATVSQKHLCVLWEGRWCAVLGETGRLHGPIGGRCGQNEQHPCIMTCSNERENSPNRLHLSHISHNKRPLFQPLQSFLSSFEPVSVCSQLQPVEQAKVYPPVCTTSPRPDYTPSCQQCWVKYTKNNWIIYILLGSASSGKLNKKTDLKLKTLNRYFYFFNQRKFSQYKYVPRPDLITHWVKSTHFKMYWKSKSIWSKFNHYT